MLKVAIPFLVLGVLIGSASTAVLKLPAFGPRLVHANQDDEDFDGVYALDANEEVVKLEVCGPNLTGDPDRTRDLIFLTLPNEIPGSPGTLWKFTRSEDQNGNSTWRARVEVDLGAEAVQVMSSQVRQHLGIEPRSFGWASLSDTNNDGLWDEYFESSMIRSPVAVTPAGD